MAVKRPTIKDLARELGITPAAVSKALNDKPDISQVLKERVRIHAEQRGYVPDPQARRLVTGSRRILGVLLANRFNRPVREYFGFHLLDGLLERCQADDFDLMLLQETDSAGRRHDYLDQARRRGAGALVVYGLDAADPQLAALAVADLPCAAVDSPLPGRPFVTTDQRGGIAAAMEHLSALGHRRFAYVGLRGEGWVARERRAGFRSALAEIPGASALETTAALSVAGGRESGLAILSASPCPSAVVCAADLQAYGVLAATREIGLSVPGELSLTGFDDLHASAYLDPPLTTIAQDPRALGWTAADLALRSWRGEAVPETTCIPARLVARGSTGATHEQR
jgi:DNA-binding LacI/PurR family transcriptional regulator